MSKMLLVAFARRLSPQSPPLHFALTNLKAAWRGVAPVLYGDRTVWLTLAYSQLSKRLLNSCQSARSPIA